MDTIIDESKAIIQPLDPTWYERKVAQVDMLRLDRLHPIISGNKWYKLKHNIVAALAARHKSILTFGGAYSNHLIATAAAAKAYNIQAIGIVRGTHYGQQLTPTLQTCRALGMQLQFVSKEDYSKKIDTIWLQQLLDIYDHPFIIPEGGSNEWGSRGTAEIATLIPAIYTHICVSVGTGTTLIGLRNALPITQSVLGFVPMKNGSYLQPDIQQQLQPAKDNNWQLFDHWHFNGFGKWTGALLDFMNNFYRANQIPLDIIYTSKMMFAIRQLINEDFFSSQSSILCIHTGGLQGNSSVQEQLIYPPIE